MSALRLVSFLTDLFAEKIVSTKMLRRAGQSHITAPVHAKIVEKPVLACPLKKIWLKMFHIEAIKITVQFWFFQDKNHE